MYNYNMEIVEERIRREFADHPDMPDVTVTGAVYDLRTGEVEWLE